MEFNGDSIIKIATNLFDINKSELAQKYLLVSKSALSRPLPYNYNIDAMYDNVFNPDNERSAASGMSTSDLRDMLLDLIKKYGYKDILEDLFDKDYEGLVKGMLRRGKMSESNTTSAKKRTSKQVSLQCDILPKKPFLLGREDELASIEKILKTSNYAVLTGINGIGKSFVAAAYASVLSESSAYTIQRVMCEDNHSFQSAIIQLKFDNLPDPIERLTSGFYVDLLLKFKKPILIILDDLNMRFTQEDYDTIQKLEKNKEIHFLITSKYEIINDKRKVIRIEPLDSDLLLELYMHHRFDSPGDHSSYINEHKEILREIFDRVGNHTLMVELLAKLPKQSGMDEYEISKRLNEGIDISSETVQITKDGVFQEDTVKEIIKTLFIDSNLSDTKKNILGLMTLVYMSGMRLNMFAEMSGCPTSEIVELCNDNWIILDEETLRIRLHPLILDTILVVDDMKPTIERCFSFMYNVSTRLTNAKFRSLEFRDLIGTVFGFSQHIAMPMLTSYDHASPLQSSFQAFTKVLTMLNDSFDERLVNVRVIVRRIKKETIIYVKMKRIKNVVIADNQKHLMQFMSALKAKATDDIQSEPE